MREMESKLTGNDNSLSQDDNCRGEEVNAWEI